MGLDDRVADYLVEEYGATRTHADPDVHLMLCGESGPPSEIVWKSNEPDVRLLARRLGRDAKEAVGRGGIAGGMDLILVYIDEALLTFEGRDGQLIVGPEDVYVRED